MEKWIAIGRGDGGQDHGSIFVADGLAMLAGPDEENLSPYDGTRKYIMVVPAQDTANQM